ncbi:MAG: hypothetical protein QXW20_07535 [Ignisphaera sp.]
MARNRGIIHIDRIMFDDKNVYIVHYDDSTRMRGRTISQMYLSLIYGCTPFGMGQWIYVCDVIVVDSLNRVIGIGFIKRSLYKPLNVLFIDGALNELCSIKFDLLNIDMVASLQPIPCLEGWKNRRVCKKRYINVYEYPLMKIVK